MMLIQSSIPSSNEAAVSSVSDYGQQESTQVWISGDRVWQEFPQCNNHPQDGHGKAVPVTEHQNKDDSSYSPDLVSCSRLSTVTTSESSTPISVYKRRKIQRNPAAVFPANASTNTRPSGYCLSASSSETLSVAFKEHVVSLVHSSKGVPTTPHVHPTECNKLDPSLKLGSVDGLPPGDETATKRDMKGDMHKVLDLCGINDSCSSSKSNMDLGSASLKPETDDTGECSSSGALIVQGLQEDLSEKDLCISLLRNHGVLRGVKPPKTCPSAEPIGIRNDRNCSRSCKVCLQSEMTLKMLICDHCEEAFHVSCCNLGIKKIPIDEWFCHSCFRKKLKELETGSSKSLNVVSDKGRRKTVTSKDESGPIAFMLRDTEPYTTNVRVGKEFQAEVPDWSGPISNEVDYFGEAAEVNPSECGSYQGWNSSKPSRLSSIGNWLQCQDCGKWRRAPLFEVQSGNWECFSSVHWDPTHSDCAVPQELDTDQVLKQLKYIEMLRPRLSAKRSKLSVMKGFDSQELKQDQRNTQTI